MITAALNDVKENLSGLLQKAAEEDVIITSDGRPVGVLRGFADEDEFEEYRLLNDPRFHSIIAESRKQYSAGKFTRIEDIDNE